MNKVCCVCGTYGADIWVLVHWTYGYWYTGHMGTGTLDIWVLVHWTYGYWYYQLTFPLESLAALQLGGSPLSSTNGIAGGRQVRPMAAAACGGGRKTYGVGEVRAGLTQTAPPITDWCNELLLLGLWDETRSRCLGGGGGGKGKWCGQQT